MCRHLIPLADLDFRTGTKAVGLLVPVNDLDKELPLHIVISK